MLYTGTIHLFIFIQAVDRFILGNIPEVLIIRKDGFLIFDGEILSFGYIIKYGN
jgi:hypothetical protein